MEQYSNSNKVIDVKSIFLKGINFDVGTFYTSNVSTRPVFDDDAIREDIRIIKDELYCNCIRISGYDIDRLIKTSEFALELGLQVWLSPIFIDATQEQFASYIVECAIAAEKIRKKYENIVFVAGCEYSLYLNGFIIGRNTYERIAKMFNPIGIISNALGLRNKAYMKMNIFLNMVVKNIRSEFKGKVTYASGTWEKVDWSIFDIVSINHYRTSYNQSNYVKTLKSYNVHRKPVAITEFGCCTYKGAEKLGGGGWNIIEVKDGQTRIKSNYERSETTQANYIVDLLELFEKEENIYAVFVFTFINPEYKYNPDPIRDFDMASYGIVKPINRKDQEGLQFIPKEAFYRLADYYGRK